MSFVDALALFVQFVRLNPTLDPDVLPAVFAAYMAGADDSEEVRWL